MTADLPSAPQAGPAAERGAGTADPGAVEGAPPTSAPPAPGRRRGRVVTVSAVLAVVLVGALIAGAVVRQRSSARGFGLEAAAGDAPADYRYDIPAGSGAALIRGERLSVLPESLDVTLGQVIEIRNGDDRGHLVGPFFVGANETVRYRFAARGTYTGVCSVHPSGQIVINVA